MADVHNELQGLHNNLGVCATLHLDNGSSNPLCILAADRKKIRAIFRQGTFDSWDATYFMHSILSDGIAFYIMY